MQGTKNHFAVPAWRAHSASRTVPHLELAQFEVDLSNPMHIHQHALDVTGDALRRNDFETFAHFFRVPHVVCTFTEQQTISTRTDLHLLFQNSRQQIEDAGATHRIRTSFVAEFKEP